jgi:hypothetical protein
MQPCNTTAGSAGGDCAQAGCRECSLGACNGSGKCP